MPTITLVDVNEIRIQRKSKTNVQIEISRTIDVPGGGATVEDCLALDLTSFCGTIFLAGEQVEKMRVVYHSNTDDDAQELQELLQEFFDGEALWKTDLSPE